MPQEFGGRGASLYDMVLTQEILASGCGSTAMAIDMTMHVIGRIGEMRNYPPAIYATICHDIVHHGALLNAVASEKELGSPSRGGLPQTTASWDGQQWRINGHKLFVLLCGATVQVSKSWIPGGMRWHCAVVGVAMSSTTMCRSLMPGSSIAKRWEHHRPPPSHLPAWHGSR
ncbi:MAG: acyl-CoA/acyl-ACP dehydrogenase [Chloroflexaceae bacterium]|nr:acyl-CoA/acyl-ACP dehydrogenase [Chloroflexaceae bacterium]